MTDSTRNLLARAHGQWRAERFAEPETSAQVYRLDTHRVQPMPADVIDTTRRYPRTLHGVDAAFRNDPGYADPFLRFEAGLDWLDSKWPLVFALAVAIGALLGYLAVARWA